MESPADAKQQFGETKVVTFDEDGINKYRYEDDYIDIVWYVGKKQFNFTLKNKSGHSMKINWDDVSYVDINGRVGRVMHSGVKYTERNNSQPATTIPNGATINDLLLPTENVYLISNYWHERDLIPTNGEASIIGKTMSIMLPIMIENIQNDYLFTFSINELLDTESK